MWLASVSKRDRRGEIVGAYRWRPEEWSKARRILWGVLRGRGDQRYYRLFRMQVTACLNVALNRDELVLMPPEWAEIRGTSLAGGAVRNLEWGGIEITPSCEPCQNPEKQPLDGCSYDPHLWFPLDCGSCPPCEARTALESGALSCALPGLRNG